MRRIVLALTLTFVTAGPVMGQERGVFTPSPAEPAGLWVAISSTSSVRMSGKIALSKRDPKGPSVQAINLNSSKSNVYRAIGLAGGSVATLDLEAAETVAGVQSMGDPVSGTEITLEPIPEGTARTARTDARGRFVFEGLAPGGYQLGWEAGGQRHYQQVWIEEQAGLRENGLEGACRRKCAAENTNAQGALNADAYAACMRACRSGAAICPGPDNDAANREPCPEDRPACPAGEDITCVRGRWVCIGAAEPSN